MSEPLALRFARDITAAMLHAHRMIPEFVHGDLKPENVLITSSLTTKLSDFGLARGGGVVEGAGLGTPLYRAPECWAGGGPTEKADIYAFGLILFEMITGEHPFRQARTDDELSTWHAEVNPPDLDGELGPNSRTVFAEEPI